ncbi:MAG: ATP synthase F1 subunit epsilon [Lachnospiraceae bacterium]
MELFELRIVTPDGLLYSGPVRYVKVRSIVGDIAILARHIDYVTALGMGECKVVMEDEQEQYAACIGGMISVKKGTVVIVATTFEWADDLDAERIDRAKSKAKEREEAADNENELMRAKAKLQRVAVRKKVIGRKK